MKKRRGRKRIFSHSLAVKRHFQKVHPKNRTNISGRQHTKFDTTAIDDIEKRRWHGGGCDPWRRKGGFHPRYSVMHAHAATALFSHYGLDDDAQNRSPLAVDVVRRLLFSQTFYFLRAVSTETINEIKTIRAAGYGTIIFTWRVGKCGSCLRFSFLRSFLIRFDGTPRGQRR